MEEMIMIASAAVTTGSILGPAGARIAENPHTLALTVVLLLASLIMCALAACRVAPASAKSAPVRKSMQPRLRRRLCGPRDRRA